MSFDDKLCVEAGGEKVTRDRPSDRSNIREGKPSKFALNELHLSIRPPSDVLSQI